MGGDCVWAKHGAQEFEELFSTEEAHFAADESPGLLISGLSLDRSNLQYAE
jgi:hypothetical protein